MSDTGSIHKHNVENGHVDLSRGSMLIKLSKITPSSNLEWFLG